MSFIEKFEDIRCQRCGKLERICPCVALCEQCSIAFPFTHICGLGKRHEEHSVSEETGEAPTLERNDSTSKISAEEIAKDIAKKSLISPREIARRIDYATTLLVDQMLKEEREINKQRQAEIDRLQHEHQRYVSDAERSIKILQTHVERQEERHQTLLAEHKVFETRTQEIINDMRTDIEKRVNEQSNINGVSKDVISRTLDLLSSAVTLLDESKLDPELVRSMKKKLNEHVSIINGDTPRSDASNTLRRTKTAKLEKKPLIKKPWKK